MISGTAYETGENGQLYKSTGNNSLSPDNCYFQDAGSVKVCRMAQQSKIKN